MDIKPIETRYAGCRFRLDQLAASSQALKRDFPRLLLWRHRIVQSVFTVGFVLRLSLVAVQKSLACLVSVAGEAPSRAIGLNRCVLRRVAMAMLAMWAHFYGIQLFVARYAQRKVVAGGEAVQAPGFGISEQAHSRRFRAKRSLYSRLTSAKLAGLLQQVTDCEVSSGVGKAGGRSLFHVLDYTTVLQEPPTVHHSPAARSARFEFGETPRAKEGWGNVETAG